MGKISAWISQSEYARRINRSQQLVNKWCRSGMMPTNKDGKINPELANKVLAEREAHRNEKGKTSLRYQQTRLTKYQADIAAMESEEMAAGLIEPDIAHREIEKFVRAVRRRTLRVPSEVYSVLRKCKSKTVGEHHKIIQDAIHRALNDCATYDPETGLCEYEQT